MTGDRIELAVAALVGLGILYLAVRMGEINSGGSTTYRARNPILFWMSVGFAGSVVVGLVVLLIANLISPDRG